MADAIITSFSHQYNGEETTEIFLKPIIQTEEVFDRYRILPNVVGKKNIYLRGIAEKILKKMVSCTFAPSGQVSLTDKTIETHPVAIHLEQCERAFNDTIFEKEFLKIGTSRTDLTGTAVQNLIQNFILDSLKRDVPRGLWFNKIGATNPNYDYGFNGWLQLMLTNTALLGKFHNITAQESGASLITDGSKNVFQILLEQISPEIFGFGIDKIKFYATRSIVNNFKRTLRASGSDFGAITQVNGVEKLSFDGIEIIPMNFWDVDLADTQNPTPANLNTTSKSIVVLTVPDNLIIGIDAENAGRGNDAQIWFSMDNQTLRAVVNFQLGAQLMHEKLIGLAA